MKIIYHQMLIEKAGLGFNYIMWEVIEENVHYGFEKKIQRLIYIRMPKSAYQRRFSIP